MELLAGDGRRLILDAGSGLVGLDDVLRREGKQAPILLTHYHWDHLQGLPFFTPLYLAGATPTIWAPDTEALESGWVETIFKSPFFPVPFEQLPSPPTIHPIDVGDHDIDGFKVRAIRLNHPGGAFAYRVEGAGGALVYATDHEMGLPEYDEPLADLARGTKLLIFDAHFTPDEGPAHKNWGHSTWAEAARFAAETGVERLWLFHHKPGRTDIELTEIEADTRKIFAHADASGEGDTIEL